MMESSDEEDFTVTASLLKQRNSHSAPNSTNSVGDFAKHASVVEQRKEELNSTFGTRLWAHNISNKPQSSSIAAHERGADAHLTFGNVVWAVLFGWWMGVLFAVVSGIMYLTFIGRRYSRLSWMLSKYLFWPFGYYIVEKEVDPEIIEISSNNFKHKIEYSIWFVVVLFLVLPFLFIALVLNWILIISMPMYKTIIHVVMILYKDPSSIEIVDDYSMASGHTVLICIFRSFNLYYLRYKVGGMNVVFFNLLPVVLIKIGFIIAEMSLGKKFMSTTTSFVVDLLCIVPITFYIGNAVSSIAAQTTYMLGALLNVTFGSLVNVIIFAFAMKEGGLNEVIVYAISGTILLDLLLLPGLSMIAGGIKYQQQNFNPVAAGVGSIYLFISVVGAFTPTLFYYTFGGFRESCGDCHFVQEHNVTHVICSDCHNIRSSESILSDPLYEEGLRILMYITAGLLPTSYFIGLFFTFKTHTHLFTQEEEEGEEGDGGPAWSILVCVIVLAFSVAMAAIIADDVVKLLEEITEQFGIGQPFIGLTVMAVIPSMTELVNAIKFATHNQISLSLEIGSSAAVQTSLIQVPILIILSAIFTQTDPEVPAFTLIFPMLSVFGCIISVVTFNYVLQDGKTNYFIGAALFVIYLLLAASFYFIPKEGDESTHHYYIAALPKLVK
eukprot:TRINITY_DN6264_c0_g2_i2.p1 TRINITY_DN6264_c0_g2~~TRINITY_DN6264_c0_g2_i2.p1  ORF type:complete len:666 (+),score=150.88 TRINITY_DN6264_c0_g2_i2:1-1998(+)